MHCARQLSMHFQPWHVKCVTTTFQQEPMTIGLTLLEDDDPDLRRSYYNLFVSIALAVQEEVAKAPMENAVTAMLDSAKSNKTIKSRFGDDELEAEDSEQVPNENEERRNRS